MSLLFKRAYTATYSVIFGIFLSMIPNMLTPSCTLGLDAQSAAAVALLVLGFGVSFFLGDLERNLRRVRRLIKKEENEC